MSEYYFRSGSKKNITKAENKKYLNNGYIIGVINQKGLDSIPIAVKRMLLGRYLRIMAEML